MFATHHPQLLIDQGHYDMYTIRGRYEVVAKLATADGFDVLSDGNPFTVKDLKDAAVLLIADALGTGDLKSPAVSRPAFTVAECDVLTLEDFTALGETHPRIKIRMLENLALGLSRKLRKANREIAQLV